MSSSAVVHTPGISKAVSDPNIRILLEEQQECRRAGCDSRNTPTGTIRPAQPGLVPVLVPVWFTSQMISCE